MGSEHGVGWRAKWSDLNLEEKVKIDKVFDMFFTWFLMALRYVISMVHFVLGPLHCIPWVHSVLGPLHGIPRVHFVLGLLHGIPWVHFVLGPLHGIPWVHFVLGSLHVVSFRKSGPRRVDASRVTLSKP